MCNFLPTMAMQFQEIVTLLLSYAEVSVCTMACAGNATAPENCREIMKSLYSGNFSSDEFCQHTR